MPFSLHFWSHVHATACNRLDENNIIYCIHRHQPKNPLRITWAWFMNDQDHVKHKRWTRLDAILFTKRVCWFFSYDAKIDQLNIKSDHRICSDKLFVLCCCWPHKCTQTHVLCCTVYVATVWSRFQLSCKLWSFFSRVLTSSIHTMLELNERRFLPLSSTFHKSRFFVVFFKALNKTEIHNRFTIDLRCKKWN